MPEKLLHDIAKDYRLTLGQLEEIFRLLDRGHGLPYLMRYHKGLAAGLSPEQLYELSEHKRRADRLERRRSKVLKKLRQQGVLSEDLEEQIRQAPTTTQLMDIYIPYRPRKHSRSRRALAQGLRPLATEVISQQKHIEQMGVAAQDYVNPDIGLNTVEDVLRGVYAILCDWIAEEETHRGRQREIVREASRITCRRSGKSVPHRIASEFKEFFDYDQNANALHPYHMLRITRGKRLKVLKYRVEPPLEEMYRAAAELYVVGGAERYNSIMAGLPQSFSNMSAADIARLTGTELLCLAIKKSVTDTLAPVLARELEQELRKKAERLALEIARRDLRSLLMARPTPGQRILGISGGYRTGCKLAALDESGNVLATDIVYPHTPRYEVEEAKNRIAALIKEHGISLVAIGDGTACQETEALLSEIIQEHCPHVHYAVVPQVGLQAYSKSKLAKQELPTCSPEHRVSVAIGRRLSDPLAELVKSEPLELCTTQYAQDVDKGQLEKALIQVIEECVCKVGVDLNTASEAALRYVSGFDEAISAAIVQRRQTVGPFKSREELKEVPGVDSEVFRQAAGFVKVKGSDNPLDCTRIHPDSYPVARKICEQISVPLESIGTPDGGEEIKKKRSQIKLSELEKEFGIHYLVLKDIIEELIEPWPDPRMGEQLPILRQHQLTFEELKPKQVVRGTVRNVVEFGVFVDIGVGEDGLVHISELSDRYVHSPFDVVSVGDVVTATVMEVDHEKRRIALSMRSHPREAPSGKASAQKPPSADEPVTAPSSADDRSIKRKTGKAIQRPQSTLGWSSRRVEKAGLDRPLSKTDQQILKPKAGKSGDEPQAKRKGGGKKEAKKEEGSSLLDRLDFAVKERRGKPSG